MFLLASLASVSEAATYSTNFAIIQPAPTEHTEGDVLSIAAWDVATGYPDQVVPSDWPYVRCEIEDGAVHMIFQASKTAWPTSFPSTVTCTAGGHSLVATLKPVPVITDYDHDLSLSVGMTIPLKPNVGTYRLYNLPVGPSYQPGTSAARLSPTTTWSGVKCVMVYTDGQPFLQVYVDASAPADDGFCVLQTPGGPQPVPVTITR